MPATPANTITPRRAIKNQQVTGLINLGYVALVSDRARLRELERENRELRMKAEFLGKAAAFFAQVYR